LIEFWKSARFLQHYAQKVCTYSLLKPFITLIFKYFSVFQQTLIKQVKVCTLSGQLIYERNKTVAILEKYTQ